VLLRPDKLIHVKWKSGSSTLSHLFSQGVVSAALLWSDAGFRDAVRARVAANPGFGRVIPTTDLDPARFEIVYAVIARPPGKGRHYLPFFSQVNFRRAVKDLEARGYRVSLARVDVAPR
jgi:uncharacterized protein (TIGR04141 family)